jgi:hypothetical protein
MSIPLGLNCKALQNTGTFASPTWTERSSVTNVEVAGSRATADVSRRSTGGYRAKVGTLAEGDVTFDLISDRTDAFIEVVETAYRNQTTLDIWFGDGPIATTGTRGFRAAFVPTDFSESQQLEDAVRFSVTLSVSGSTPTPGYYESNGSALALVTGS